MQPRYHKAVHISLRFSIDSTFTPSPGLFFSQQTSLSIIYEDLGVDDGEFEETTAAEADRLYSEIGSEQSTSKEKGRAPDTTTKRMSGWQCGLLYIDLINLQSGNLTVRNICRSGSIIF